MEPVVGLAHPCAKEFLFAGAYRAFRFFTLKRYVHATYSRDTVATGRSVFRVSRRFDRDDREIGAAAAAAAADVERYRSTRSRTALASAANSVVAIFDQR